VAMRALREPDAFPCGDLGLLHALDLNTPRELEQRAEAWRPWRAYAAMYLWNITSERYADGSKTALSEREVTSAASRRAASMVV
jgi:3-methyladenine DNA glycosylase/8-oxoguanine DNA glycosylase